MSKNTRTMSHLSTSFNTISMHHDDNHKTILGIFNENQKNIEQMIYFKSELLSLQSSYQKSKSES